MCEYRNYYSDMVTNRRGLGSVPMQVGGGLTEVGAGAESSEVSPAVDAGRAWLLEVSQHLTSIGRLTHSQRLYGEMGERAGLAMRPYLYGILARIRDRQPVRISDVAEDMDYDRSTISRHVAELTNLGCVARESDPADGRVVILRLTKEGTRVIERVYEAWTSTLDELTAEWSPADRETFRALLARLDESLTANFATPR
jgi:DNA-binding MarR family transcriptional regulator